MVVLDGNFALGCGPGTDYPLKTHISMYVRTNKCYNERGSITNYVRSSIPHSTISPCRETNPDSLLVHSIA